MLEPPNQDCYVCSSNWLQLVVDTEKTTLKYFVDEILKGHLGMLLPSIMVDYE